VTDDRPEDASPPEADPAESPAHKAVHHGEALVAALLDTQKIAQTDDPAADTEALVPGTPPATSSAPLTASTVISHTDPAVFTPTSAEAVVDQAGEDIGPTSSDHGSVPDADAISLSQSVDNTAESGEDGRGTQAEANDEQVDNEAEPSLARNLLEWVVVLGAAVAVAVILRTFVFQAFFIPSESMETTLFENDRILVNKVSYRLHDVNRGDVVVFRRPDDQPGEIRDLIKRVIGLPGEEVEGRDSTIYINGQLLVEPYLDGNRFGDFGPVTVPDDELFMMGDNRDQSLDSRRFGPIDEDRIIGRAFFLFWPFDRLGTL
jgi:signal peptidase I